MTPILALDLATSTGWAGSDRSGRASSGVQRFDLARGESSGMRFLRFRRWLRETLDLLAMGHPFNTDRGVIAYEQPHHRGGAATALCAGLVAIVLEEAAARELETVPVHTATLKKHATGRGNAKKPDMQAAAAKRWGPNAAGELQEDQADALCVLAWALDEIGQRVPATAPKRCGSCLGTGKVAIDCDGSLGYAACKECA